MPYYAYCLKRILLLLLWQLELVETFSIVQFFINAGSQSGAIVVAAAAGNVYGIRAHPKTILIDVEGVIFLNDN